MAQQQKNNNKTKPTESSGVPIMNNNPDNAWKAVGSPSRRGSTTASTMAHFLAEQTSNSSKISPNESPVNDHVEIIRRSSIVSESGGNNGNWGSFGGFQWEGPSIFDEENKQGPAQQQQQQQQQAPDDNNHYDSILSVPMLPGVSLEPIYRQQRSLSFSMGQDPTFFGYDDYEDNTPPTALPPNQYLKQPTFNSSLAPMEEEELEDNYFSEYDLAQFRSRSKSSGAAFGLLSQNQHSRLMNNGHVRRGSEQQDDLMINSQRRRSSSRFFNLPDQQTSIGDKEQYLRRLSQQQQDYSFPPIHNSSSVVSNTSTEPNTNYNMMRRQSLTLNTQPPSNIQQLADQLENTHLRSEIAFNPPPPAPTPHPSQQQQQQQQQYMYLQQQQYQHSAAAHTTNNSSSYLQHLQQQQPYHHHHHYTQQLQTQQQQQQQQQQQHQQVQQQAADDYFETDPRGFQDLGKGIPLSRLDPKLPLYMVEFKGGRTDFFYVLDSNQFHPQLGDLVIVEADRGKDLGKVAANTLTIDQVVLLEQKKQAQLQQLENNEKEKAAAQAGTEREEAVQQTPKQQREIHIKRIFRLAAPDEINLLLVKGQDEHKALVVCQQKTKQRKLPMEVVDAEYQWDRRKLTFYFKAENRIDFRELVRELFKIYKTRIWMCVVTTPLTLDDINATATENAITAENTTEKA